MTLSQLFIGALTLKSEVFNTLRARSDVFLRGFLVLLVAGLVTGAIGSLIGAIDTVSPLVTKEQVIQMANASFEAQYNGPPELKAMIQPYPGEIASMIYELDRLPPRAGEAGRPIAAILNYVGNTLATPFRWEMAGWMLFAGLVIHFAARLLGGRAGIAQMLGLTSLAAAPQIFSAVTSLLTLVLLTSGAGALGLLNSLLGLVIGVWSAAIYIKATAVAQNFSVWRAIVAIVLGFVFLVVAIVLLAILAALLVASLLAPVFRPVQ